MYSLVIKAPKLAEQIQPGQFVNIRVPGNAMSLLRIPLSYASADPVEGTVEIWYAVVGDGTRRLAGLHEGDVVNCMFPLGNGFTMPADSAEKVLLVGGGVGVAPLLYFGKRLNEAGCRPVFLLGARSKGDLLMLDEFGKYGDVCVTTEDGTAGERGFVTNHSVLDAVRFDRIASCGPKPMMAAVARYAKSRGIECEVSLENMMACGLGACLCCVEKTTEGNLCVCKEGPVFNINKLLWQI